MILLRVQGGLGNQMFQYAYARNLAIKYNTELAIDDTLLILNKTTDHQVTTHRDFELDFFQGLNFRRASRAEIFRFNGDPTSGTLKKIIRKSKNFLLPAKLVVQQNNEIREEYLDPGNDCCVVGRWQSWKFFNENATIVRKEFGFDKRLKSELQQLAIEIEKAESVCLHIRRGDLITSPLYSQIIGAVDLSYYKFVVNDICKNVKGVVFYVFSDDIDWCKSTLTFLPNSKFISRAYGPNPSMGDLYLISRCKHFIISNSTFAWWGAYLGESPRKKVYYPKNWYKDQKLSNPEMCPPEWVGV
jgi:hypothetical protein